MKAPPRARAKVARSADRPVLGAHPARPHPFGEVLDAKDGLTASEVPHRALLERDGVRGATIGHLRAMLVRHHVSPDALRRSGEQREALKRLGFDAQQARLRRFPANSTTQKGNLAEVVLAEYVLATNAVALPVYRLRYNPNVDQSMKGDDVLAFDLEITPPTVLVGEAKFRGASSAAAVKEIVEGLVRSSKGGLPASLQFVADRLFEQGETELGAKVLDCARLFALGELRIDYVGILLSDTKASQRVNDAKPNSLRRLAMISLGVQEPDALVEACYEGLD
jgi:hypothetical protein